MLRRALVFILALLGPANAWAELPPFVNDDGVPSLSPLLRDASPAVVSISVISNSPVEDNPLFRDPFYRRFFDLPGLPPFAPGPGPLRVSAGSGVIVDADQGFVVTNHHIVANASGIEVVLRDGRRLPADLVGTDAPTDIALLRVAADGLPALVLDRTVPPVIGDFVIAIGNPFGTGQVITSGLVSGVGRVGIDHMGFDDFIQTDAPINPGNSGGALIDLRGRLIGINSAELGPAGDHIGIGFAVPSTVTALVLDQLAAYGEVRRGRLGIAFQDVTPDIAEAFALAAADGVVVTRVEPGSVAAMAGIVSRDVIVAINGRPIRDGDDLRNEVGLAPVGAPIEIGIVRNGEPMALIAALGDLVEGPIDDGTTFDALHGAVLHDILPGMSLYGRETGVLVGTLDAGTRAARLGLREGDIIIGINQQTINNLAELAGALAQPDRSLALTIRRAGSTIFLVIG